MSLKITKSKPQISPERLRAFEAEHGISFPQPYGRFLLAHNGGVPDRDEFTYLHETGPYTDGRVECFLALHDGYHMSLAESFRLYKVEERRMPDRIVPIADDPGGNVICISVAGNDRGVVYFWDHENELEAAAVGGGDGEPGECNLHKLADDFDQFLARLRKSDGPPKAAAEVAVEAGDLDALQAMLDGGLPVSWENAEGVPLVGLAARQDDAAMVAMLLARGADRRAAWDYSRGFGRHRVLKHLIPLGVPEEDLRFLLTCPETWEDPDLVHMLFDHGVDPNGVVGSQKARPLHYSLGSRSPDVVRLVLSYGARPGVPNAYGFLALHGAAGSGDVALMKVLIDAGEDPFASGGVHARRPIDWIKDRAVRKEIIAYAEGRGFWRRR